MRSHTKTIHTESFELTNPDSHIIAIISLHSRYKSVAYNGTTLYFRQANLSLPIPIAYSLLLTSFRGYRILKALLTHLTANAGLSEATDVILTGCSGNNSLMTL